MRGGKLNPESPWLPLPSEKRPRFMGTRRWIRSNAAIAIGTISALAAATAVIVALINVGISEHRFRIEHRPWLMVRIAKDTLEWREELYEAVPIVRNVGAGPALWFYGAGLRFDTREPLAQLPGRDLKAKPTRMLPPGDSTYLRSSMLPVDTSPQDVRPFYYHHVIWYGGTAREETLYLEQVFYVDPRPDARGVVREKPQSGEECTYIGRVRAGAVALEGTANPDTVRRMAATFALDELAQRLTPPLDLGGRTPTSADTITIIQSSLRALRDSAIWSVYIESLHKRGFRDDDIDFARAMNERIGRRIIESLTERKPLSR
jgi:hypothetical protein